MGRGTPAIHAFSPWRQPSRLRPCLRLRHCLYLVLGMLMASGMLLPAAGVDVSNPEGLVAAVAQFGASGQDLHIILTQNISIGDSTSFDPTSSLTAQNGIQPFSQGQLTISAAAPNTVLDAAMRSTLMPNFKGVAKLFLGLPNNATAGFTMINLCEQVWPPTTHDTPKIHTQSPPLLVQSPVALLGCHASHPRTHVQHCTALHTARLHAHSSCLRSCLGTVPWHLPT